MIIEGPVNNLDFLRALLASKEFQNGNYNCDYIKDNIGELTAYHPDSTIWAIGAILLWQQQREHPSYSLHQRKARPNVCRHKYAKNSVSGNGKVM